MKFRPCIDIHNGEVKQIVGGSLKDAGDKAETNFVSHYDAAHYANLYRRDGLTGGHIIMLNPASSSYYEATKKQAMKALEAYPGGMQIGGGVTAENAEEYLAAGASHVIVTSYVFCNGEIRWDRLKTLSDKVGKERVVLDLSCRKREDAYYIVTDRWQTFTKVCMEEEILERLSDYCDEFLIHGVDVEGSGTGMDGQLVSLLSRWERCPITYAGGIGTIEDLKAFERMSGGRMDFTIGSALDLFGGTLPYDTIRSYE